MLIRALDLNKAYLSRLSSLDRDRISARIWSKEGDVWSSDAWTQGQAMDFLGWLDSPGFVRGHLKEIDAFGSEIQKEKLKGVLLIGMGGSSLCPDLFRSLPRPNKAYSFDLLDTTDADQIAETAGRIAIDQTLFIVASKSGTTIEVESLYRYFKDRARPSQFIAITDPGTPLDQLATKEGFRRIFRNPPDIGGRFSALSYFGMVPAKLMGFDVSAIVSKAEEMARACGASSKSDSNPGLQLGAFLAEAIAAGRDKIYLCLPPSLRLLGDWIEQQVAESTGKNGTGILPVIVTDRNVVSLKDAVAFRYHWKSKPPETAPALPTIDISLESEASLGAEFFRWEFAMAVLGAVLQINPFDQPDVEEAKKKAREFLAKPKAEPFKGIPGVDSVSADSLAALSKAAGVGGYIAILAYLSDRPDVRKELENLRAALEKHFQIAVTWGYGPRYLHSTGQYHKGGPRKGAFLFLLDNKKESLPVPGAKYSFEDLQVSQALGDIETLKKLGRKVLSVNCQDDPVEGIRSILERIN